jgi:hypothetical protein
VIAEGKLPGFSNSLTATLQNALSAASTRRHEYATLEHLLLALIDDPDASAALKACAVDVTLLRKTVVSYLDEELNALKTLGDTDPAPTSGFQRAVQRALLHVQSTGLPEVTGVNVLVSLFSERESYAVYFLKQQDLARLDIVSYLSGSTRALPTRAAAASKVEPKPRKARRPKVFVSYAWGDNLTEAGRNREDVVERLCASASSQGVDIRRDKSSLTVGDSIGSFMRKIGRGDRIFVILSKKYLESDYCMYELSEVWRNSKQDRKTFLEKIRIFALEDANIYKPRDWVNWALHWKKEHDELDSLAREHGASILGSLGHKRLIQMQQFYMHVADILGTIADVVIPRTSDELER